MFLVFIKQRALVVINKPSDEELLSTFLHKGVSVRNWLDACIADQGISRGTVTTFAIFNTQRTAKKVSVATMTVVPYSEVISIALVL
jgi:hypothetical protein